MEEQFLEFFEQKYVIVIPTEFTRMDYRNKPRDRETTSERKKKKGWRNTSRRKRTL